MTKGFGEWYDGGELIPFTVFAIHRTTKDLNKSNC